MSLPSIPHYIKLTILSSLIYIISSCSLSIFIKYQVSYSSFNYPLLSLSLQFALNFVAQGAFLYAYKGSLSWDWQIAKHYIIIGILLGADYAISNVSFRYNSNLFYSLIKSTGPVFTLAASWIFGTERFHWVLLLSVGMMSLGLMVASFYTQFYFIGMVLLLVANVLMAIRMVYAQIMLQKDRKLSVAEMQRDALEDEAVGVEMEIYGGDVEATRKEKRMRGTGKDAVPLLRQDGEVQMEAEEVGGEGLVEQDAGQHETPLASNTPPAHNSPLPPKRASRKVSTLQAFLYVAPATSMFVFPFAVLFEGKRAATDIEMHETTFSLLWWMSKVLLSIIVVAILGFALNVSEFLVIQLTSSLTLVVVGIIKTVGTVLIAYVIYQDDLNFQNIVGYSITIAGVVLYQLYRYQQQVKSVETDRGLYAHVTQDDDSDMLTEDVDVRQVMEMYNEPIALDEGDGVDKDDDDDARSGDGLV